MFYELTTLSSHILKLPQVIKNAEAYLHRSEISGHWLGAWTSENGPLGSLRMLRGFNDTHELARERERALHHSNPFGATTSDCRIEMESYAGFSFLPPVEPGSFGKYYEFRTYWLRPGGLEPTIEAWKAAMPERSKRSPLTVNMYALDGAPRITHIWPWQSLDERIAIRAKSYADGVWPPKGGPDQFFDATSTIWIPTENSPLR
ncbi:NIPSNAP family protein [Paraburkholderia hospita]|uniref:NIPSNAP family protein n=1 Tax=Paraburkholderia hospita TaxID=169430 RepID=A0AAN1JCE1_9BURK|nr:NIPSNAP family protein [Paraburkholderia hospita]AUT71232.1 NIPSNAP family protein [Paraburkholderia hospita]EIM96018.1 NIPSNAP family protein [Paraburkholderia hospita]OUL75442.1 NIPSNAP family protein [Paraburkholderia hospita]SEI26832.1 NIPSNAP protein [Paraburkholderia hospita]